MIKRWWNLVFNSVCVWAWMNDANMTDFWFDETAIRAMHVWSSVNPLVHFTGTAIATLVSTCVLLMRDCTKNLHFLVTPVCKRSFWKGRCCQKEADPIFPVQTSLALVTLPKCIMDSIFARRSRTIYIECPKLEFGWRKSSSWNQL